jgi:hypothetical protein
MALINTLSRRFCPKYRTKNWTRKIGQKLRQTQGCVPKYKAPPSSLTGLPGPGVACGAPFQQHHRRKMARNVRRPAVGQEQGLNPHRPTQTSRGAARHSQPLCLANCARCPVAQVLGATKPALAAGAGESESRSRPPCRTAGSTSGHTHKLPCVFQVTQDPSPDLSPTRKPSPGPRLDPSPDPFPNPSLYTSTIRERETRRQREIRGERDSERERNREATKRD